MTPAVAERCVFSSEAAAAQAAAAAAVVAAAQPALEPPAARGAVTLSSSWPRSTSLPLTSRSRENPSGRSVPPADVPKQPETIDRPGATTTTTTTRATERRAGSVRRAEERRGSTCV